jgi:hypothetical protein
VNFSKKLEFSLTMLLLDGIELRSYFFPGKITPQQVTSNYIEVDVWSVGCIMAELLRRKPFLPGCDTKTQIELTFEVIGTPSEQELDMIPK